MGTDADGEAVSMRRVLIFSPHPDDLELSAGLLCHEAMRLGWTVSEVVLTDGSAGGVNTEEFHTEAHVARRESEAKLSGKLLGINSTAFWRFKDGQLSAHQPLAEKMAQAMLREIRPHAVVFPSIRDTHADHVCTHRIVKAALAQFPDAPHELQYCFWGSDASRNLTLTNRDGMRAKDRAIKCHQSQPVETYLRQRYGEPRVSHPTERFYCPTAPESARALARCGLRVTATHAP